MALKGQSAMARTSYVVSVRAMALGPPTLAWFCAAPWPVLSPPLTPLDRAGAADPGQPDSDRHFPAPRVGPEGTA